MNIFNAFARQRAFPTGTEVVCSGFFQRRDLGLMLFYCGLHVEKDLALSPLPLLHTYIYIYFFHMAKLIYG